MEGWLIRAKQPRSKAISCKGQGAAPYVLNRHSRIQCLWGVFVWGFGVLFLSYVCVCRCWGCCSLSMCVCVCDLLIFLPIPVA